MAVRVPVHTAAATATARCGRLASMFAHADRAWQTPWVSIACLCIDFHLSGCRSLKDKRQRLSGLRDRFGRNPNLAVFESEGADDHARAQWTFVAAAASARVVEQLLAGIERDIETLVDAEVVAVRREWLD